MNSHQKPELRFDTALDTPNRIALVLAAYQALGYINRKSLMTMYNITERQAGSLMRDFIHVHANDIQWNKDHGHYNMDK